MINESLRLLADQVIDPGLGRTVRETYNAKLMYGAAGWRTLFQNKDLLVKEIRPAGDGKQAL